VTSLVIVGADALLDDRRARATSVAWAVEAYPAAVTPPIPVARVVPHVTDAFTSDEDLATRLICGAIDAPPAAVEASLVARLVAERRYGERLYLDAFGGSTLSWHGAAALDAVVARPYELPTSSSVVVVSPRPQLEVMTNLVSTGWASRVSGVITGDDVLGAVDVPVALLELAVARLKRRHGSAASIGVESGATALRGAAPSLGLTLRWRGCRSASTHSRT